MKSVGSDKVIIVSNKIRKTTTSIRIITFARCSHIQVSCEYIVDECLEIPRKRRDKKRKQNYKKVLSFIYPFKSSINGASIQYNEWKLRQKPTNEFQFQ